MTTRRRQQRWLVSAALTAGLCWIPASTQAQSVVLEADRVRIQDAGDATKVDIGVQVITKGTEIKVVGPGPDLQALIAAITDAGPSRQYVIRLGPGIYTLTSTLVMKEYVSLAGSGELVTRLTGSLGGSTVATAAVVDGANNTRLTDLTVENTGGGSGLSIAVRNQNASPNMRAVTAIASGGSLNIGVRNQSSSPSMIDVLASASGGSNAQGILNFDGSNPTMQRVTASASGATSTNRGVINSNNSSPTMNHVIASAAGGSNAYGVTNVTCSPTMVQVTAGGSGGNNNFGVNNSSGSSPTMVQVDAMASGGGTFNFGVYNSGLTDSPLIRDSTLEGSTAGLRMGGSTTVEVVGTRIVGGVADDPAGTQCRENYDEDLANVSC